MNTTFYVVGLIFAIIVLAAMILIEIRKKRNKRPPIPKEDGVLASPATETKEEDKTNTITYPDAEVRFYDSITRTIYNGILPGATVAVIRMTYQNLGRKWLRYGKWLYAINKYIGEDGNVLYRPVLIEETMDNSPSKLHRALRQDAVGIAYDVRDEKGFMEKYGKVLVFVVIVLFFMWTTVMK